MTCQSTIPRAASPEARFSSVIFKVSFPTPERKYMTPHRLHRNFDCCFRAGLRTGEPPPKSAAGPPPRTAAGDLVRFEKRTAGLFLPFPLPTATDAEFWGSVELLEAALARDASAKVPPAPLRPRRDDMA